MPRRKRGASLTPNKQAIREQRQRVQTRDQQRREQRANRIRGRDIETENPNAKRQRVVRGTACQTEYLEKDQHPDLSPHSCGELNVVCQFCKARRWTTERQTMCCQNGKVNIPIPPPPPPEMMKFYDITQSRPAFLPLSRGYNNALALASIGCQEYVQPGFNPTFTIQGKLCHRIGSLLPIENQAPKFAQLFFHDSVNETNNGNMCIF